MGISQTVLFFFYILVMNKISKSLESDVNDANTFMWLVGVVIMVTVGEKEAGESFDFSAWIKIWRASSASEHRLTKLSVGLRCFFDWSVNSIFRQVLLATTSILLSTEEPLDFIKDVLAIAFISTLDDPTDDQEDQAKDVFYLHARRGDGDPDKERFLDKFDEGTKRIGCTAGLAARYMWEILDKKTGTGGSWVVLSLWHNLCCNCCKSASGRENQA